MSNNTMTDSEAKKVDAEIAKLLAETGHLNTQRIWYPIFVAGTLLAGGAGAAALILRLAGAL